MELPGTAYRYHPRTRDSVASLPLILPPLARTVPRPEQGGGDATAKLWRPCSSICWNHKFPGNLLCPSTSLVCRQLERPEKSCTHFNWPKGPCFPFLLWERPNLPTPFPRARRNVPSLWETEMQSSHKAKICPNSQPWAFWVIINSGY